MSDIIGTALDVLALSAEVYSATVILNEAIEDECLDSYVNAQRCALSVDLIELDRAVDSLRKAIGEQGGEED